MAPPQVMEMLERRLKSGAWKYPGGRLQIRSRDDYDQLETYRVLGQLVEKYSLSRSIPR